MTDPLLEELKEWIMTMLTRPDEPNDAPSSHSNLTCLSSLAVEVASSPNVVDNLRDGVLLSFLVQSLRGVAYDAIRLPKRSTGFFKRDNVAACLQEVEKYFPQLHVTSMIDVGDVIVGDDVPKENSQRGQMLKDRKVVTFMLNLSKAALRGGTYSGPVPFLVKLDEDIDRQEASITECELASACDDNDDDADSHNTECGAPPIVRAVPSTACLHEPQQPADRVVRKSAQTSAGLDHSSTLITSPRHSSVPPVEVYVPRRGDVIDEEVGALMNRRRRGLGDHTRLKRLAHSGAYVVYNRITKKRTVVHIRAMRSTLMIRVGGGWDVFEHWLGRHAVDVE